MTFLRKIARAVFGNEKPVHAGKVNAVPQGNENVEFITHPRWFARARPNRRAHFVPASFAPILEYLKQEHGLDIAEVYLENHKKPRRDHRAGWPASNSGIDFAISFKRRFEIQRDGILEHECIHLGAGGREKLTDREDASSPHPAFLRDRR